MYDLYPRTQLIRSAWKASAGGRFSEVALIEMAVALVEEKHRAKLRQALPALWLRLDDTFEVVDWLAATGLDGDAIDEVVLTHNPVWKVPYGGVLGGTLFP